MSFFRKITIAEQATRDLAEAERNLYSAQAALEYQAHLVGYYTATILRLTPLVAPPAQPAQLSVIHKDFP